MQPSNPFLIYPPFPSQHPTLPQKSFQVSIATSSRTVQLFKVGVLTKDLKTLYLVGVPDTGHANQNVLTTEPVHWNVAEGGMKVVK